MIAVVVSSMLPAASPVLLAFSLMAGVIIFAPQEVKTGKARWLICAVLVAIALGAATHAFYYVPYACTQDQSDWWWWLACKAESF